MHHAIFWSLPLVSEPLRVAVSELLSMHQHSGSGLTFVPLGPKIVVWVRGGCAASLRPILTYGVSPWE